MVDLLKQAADWLDGMRVKHASRKVIYRYETGFVEVNATLGRTQYEVEDEYGVRIQTSEHDFLIAADELVIAGEKILPAEGDRIEVAEEQERAVYEVMALGAEGHYRYCDPYRKTLRIHTKFIGKEPI